MTVLDELDEIEGGLTTLDDSLAATGALAATFASELSQIGREFATAQTGSRDFSRSFSRSISTAFSDILVDGAKVSDVLRDVGRKLVDSAFKSAIRPVTGDAASALGGGVQSLVAGLLPFADGGVFSQGRVTPFAKGGVVGGPVTFPMRGGTGLMGEAGPEAIMPLARGPDGSLGVRSGGGQRPVSVTFNISTPDMAGFRRSQGQIAAQMSRVLNSGSRLS